MSRINRVLGIDIDIQARGTERLDDASRRVAAFVKSVAELKALSGDLPGAQGALGALRGEIAPQSQTESNRILADQIRLERQQVDTEAARARVLAQLAVGNRDYQGAQEALTGAQRLYNTDSLEWLNIERQKQRLRLEEIRQLDQLDRARRRSAQQFESEAARRVADESRLQASRGNLTGAIGNIAVNVGEFGPRDQTRLLTLQAGLQRQYRQEVTRTAEAVQRSDEQQLAADTALATARARLAVGDRDYAGAIALLADQQKKYARDSVEWTTLEERRQRLIREEIAENARLEQSRRKAAAAFESEAARKVADQSRLQAAQGNLSGAIGNIAVNADEFGERDRTKLLTLQANLERAYRSETIQTAEAVKRAAAEQEAELLRVNNLQVRTALAANDYAAALNQTVKAQAAAVHGSETWQALEARRLEIMRQQERALDAEAIRIERLNARNFAAIAGVTAQEAGILAARGDRAGALSLIEQRLVNFAPGSREQLRLLQQHQGILNQINAEEARRLSITDRITGSLSNGLNTTLRVLGGFFLVRATLGTIGQGIRSLLFDPLIDVGREVLTITDSFRKLDVTFVGITGSLTSARDLVKQIVHASGNLPVTALEAVQGVRQVAFIPSIATTLQNPQKAGPFSEGLLRTLVGLSTINPQQGVEGAGFAVREALANQFRSLRNRFDISPDVIASTIGKRLSDLRRDPNLTLQAIQAFVESFVGPDVIDQLRNTLGVQGKRFRGLLEQFALQIGDSSFYDHFVGRFRRINDAFSAFVGSDQSKAVAERISTTLDKFTDSLVSAASRITSELLGRNVDLGGALDAGDFGTLATVGADLLDAAKDLAVRVVSLTTTMATFGARIFKDFAPANKEEREARLGYLESLSPAQPGGLRSGLREAPYGIGAVAGFAERTAAGAFDLFAPDSLQRRRTTDEEKELGDLRVEFRRAALDKGGRFNDFALQRLLPAERRQGFPESPDTAGAVEEQGRLTSGRLQKTVLGLSQFLRTTEDALKESSADVGNEVITIQKAVEELDAGVSQFASGPDGVGELFLATTEGLDKLKKLRLAAAEASNETYRELVRLKSDTTSFRGSPEELQLKMDGLREGAAQLTAFVGKGGGGGAAGTGLSGFIERVTGILNATRSLRSQLTQVGAVELRLISDKIRSLPPQSQVREADTELARISAGFGAAGRLRDQDQPFVGPPAPGSEFTTPDLETLRSAGRIPHDQESVDRLIGIIEARRQSTLALGGQAIAPEAGREAADSLQLLIDRYERLGDVGPDVLNSLRFALTKVRNESDELVRVTREVGTSVSSSFQTGIADTLVASMTGASKEIEGILNSMAKRILDTFANIVVEFTAIRGLVNPLLNDAFGLEGANKLPTLGAGGLGGLLGKLLGGAGGGEEFVGPPAPIEGQALGGPPIIRAAQGASIYAAGAAILSRTNTMIPLRGGGIAHTVEDGTPEVIVPTRGGGIGVRVLDGGRGRNDDRPIVFQIANILDSVSVARSAAARSPRTFVNPIVADARGRGVVHRAIRGTSRR